MVVLKKKITMRRLFKLGFVALICAAFSISALAAPAKVSCQGRSQAIPRDANGVLDPDALLDSAMKGKTFALTPGASMVSLESNLVQFYGLNQSLRSIPADDGRKAIERVATLIENNYVIAAKMALGASAMRNLIPQPILAYTGRYVGTMTEPYHENAELLDLQRKGIEGQRLIAKMSPKPLAFARWAVFGFTWDDAVAIDASLDGFCASSPSVGDIKMLDQAVAVARLDRNKRYEDPHVHSGGLPVGPQKK